MEWGWRMENKHGGARRPEMGVMVGLLEPEAPHRRKVACVSGKVACAKFVGTLAFPALLK